MRTARFVSLISIVALAAFCTWQHEGFIYSREALGRGELWRLFTGHFVHFTSQHLAANIAGLALLAFLMPAVRKWDVFWIGLIVPVGLAVILYAIRPELAFYGGLSGWISGLFIFVALQNGGSSDGQGAAFRAGMAIFIGKVAFEAWTGRSLFSGFEGGVVVESAAHVIGAGLGLIGYLIRPTAESGNLLGHAVHPTPQTDFVFEEKRRLPKEPPDIFWSCVAQAPDQFAKGNKKE